MKKAETKYNTSGVLFLLLMALLWVPFLQMKTRVVKECNLNGAIENISKPTLKIQTWLDESYQEGTEKYLNQNFGLRNYLVRIYNQMSFWLYKKAKANSVIVGKENYLYENNYIKAYYGRDFIGDSLIKARVDRLKYLQDTLADAGKLFFVAIAPGKAQFYPEYIPQILQGKKNSTNYESFLATSKASGLTVLDFNAWFLQLKDTARYPLYPKTGIHWSHYGMNLFFDSISKFIEKRKGIDIPDFIAKDYRLTKNYKSPDRDLEEGMNLLFDLNNSPMAYSKDTVIVEGKKKPKVMVISDSFFWGLYSKNLMRTIFDDGEFWYYNRVIYQPSIKTSTKVIDVNVHDKLLEKDVIMLLTTDANLSKFPWGFDETALKKIKNYDPLEMEKRNETIAQYMNNKTNKQIFLL